MQENFILRDSVICDYSDRLLDVLDGVPAQAADSLGRVQSRRLASYAAIRRNRQTKVGTRHRSPVYARKRGGTAFGTARLVEFALSPDDALLFGSVGPLHHRGHGKTAVQVFHLLGL